MYQYPPPGQQGQVPPPPPQQYYVYPTQYPAYPQQPQPMPQQQQQPVHQPQHYQPVQPLPPQPAAVASVRRSYQTNAAVGQETAENGLGCMGKTLRAVLILVVTAGLVCSGLAVASCDFMTFYREPPPSASLVAGQEQQSQTSGNGGGTGAVSAAQSPSVSPAAAAAAPSLVPPFNSDTNSSISIVAPGQQDINVSAMTPTNEEPSSAPTATIILSSSSSLNVINGNNNNNTQAVSDPMAEPVSLPSDPTLGPTPRPKSPVVLQAVVSSPLESSPVLDNGEFSILPVNDNGRRMGRRVLLKRSLEETSFEDWMPEYLQQIYANATIDAGIGLSRWSPDAETICRKYNYDEFDSFFQAARVGALVGILGSCLAFLLLAAEFTLCRFFCSRLLVVFCLFSAMIGQCMTFLIYGTPNCTDKYTQSYNCDVSTGTIYSIIATFFHLMGALITCQAPKSKPYLRALVEKERQKEEIVDPCCWCFVKRQPQPDGEVTPNATTDVEIGQAAPPVGVPPPIVPVPFYYAPQPHPFPNEVQVHGSANPPSIQTQGDSYNLPPPQHFPSEIQVQGEDAIRRDELLSIRQDAFIPGDSRSVPCMPTSGGGDNDSSLGGGGRSVKSQRSAYTNPEFYESDLFFDATPSIIDEESGEEDEEESGTGNYEEPQQKEEEEEGSGTGNYE